MTRPILPGLLAAVIALGCALALPMSARVPRRSAIRGCVKDTLKQPIPEGWITVTGTTNERHARGNSVGCYRVDDLAAGNYAVRASVPGFCDGVREGVMVESDDTATVDLALVLAPMSESVSYAWTGFPDVVRRVDAILHVRIEDVAAPWAWPLSGCSSQIGRDVRASVLSVARANTAPGMAVTAWISFVWTEYPQWGGSGVNGPPMAVAAGSGRAGVASPIRVSEEFVAFLEWAPSVRRLILTEDGLLVPVKNGKLSWVVDKDRSADGKEIGAFLAELRKLPLRGEKLPCD